MKKHSSAIKHLRQKIKTLAARGHGIRQEISTLAWKDTPEAQEARRTVRAARKAGGRQTLGKRFLKPHRRPETGSERYALWDAKRGVGYQAHHVLLAMGLLKDRSYKATGQAITLPQGSYAQSVVLERMAEGILSGIHEAMGEDEALKAEWTVQRVTDWLKATAYQEAA